eukprot:TRINITY_DN103167_c0_g1_i1.p1 TRINITY_DN103167_c0_g1~~TRINITY_DN103167_c0_g1_i1.p1  ORF type:complete len:447 (-),score=75.90 TRINITY_DN103167_c0_g1_i1:43-1218(-)
MRTTCVALLSTCVAGFLTDGHGAAKSFLSRAASSTRLQSDYPFYHTSEQIESLTKSFVESCGKKATVRTVGSDVSIQEVRVRNPDAKPTNRVSILFGEHSRELISPETGLQLLKMLCGQDGQKELVDNVLKTSEFQLVLNANPKSRLKVEQGDYCLRDNPAGVDLNRNWDVHWSLNHETPGSNQYPGPHPFSEPETKVVKGLLTDFMPTTFLSVHSGTKGLYMPWAFDSQHLAERNREPMLSVLKQVDKEHCQCPFGAAGKEVGYDCPGTSFDWVYDHLKAPFSFAWEIHAQSDDESDLKSRYEEKIKQSNFLGLVQQGAMLSSHRAGIVQGHDYQLIHATGSQESSYDCFDTFNPGTKEEYDKSVQNWAVSYLKLAQLTSTYLNNATEVS